MKAESMKADLSIPVKRLPTSLARLHEDALRREVREAIASMSRPAIIFNLPPTAKLNASGIDFVIRCCRDAAEYDADVAVVAANPEHRILLEVIQLTRVVPAFWTVEEAAAYLSNSNRPMASKVSPAIGCDSLPASWPRPEKRPQS
jgi:hypothetical protein